MSKTDIPMRHTLTEYPQDWAEYIGVPRSTTVRLQDTDLAQVSTIADKVFWIDVAEPYILHLEPQGYYDPQLDARLWSYNTLLSRRHNVPVHTTGLIMSEAS